MSKPTISMNVEAHYKTQSSAYDRLLDNGPLTNRKITRYLKLGYFGGRRDGLILPLKPTPKKRLSLQARLSAYE